MSEFLTVIHVYTIAEDEVSAILGADDVRLALERHVLDEGESVDIVQTIPLDESPVPSAQITQLRRARNILLRTKSKDNYDLARSLDQAIHTLESRLDPENSSVKYDWSNLIKVLREVFDGGNPLTY